LPRDLDAAIRHLDDQQLDRLVSVALEERARRKKPVALEGSQRKRQDRLTAAHLPKGKLMRCAQHSKRVSRHCG
jgi:hypothetical protein